jgi:hypothetical protein
MATREATFKRPGPTLPARTPRRGFARRAKLAIPDRSGLMVSSARRLTSASFTTGFTPSAGWIGAQFANDTSAFSGSLYGVIAVKGGISDADLLVLEQFMNSLTPTGVSF